MLIMVISVVLIDVFEGRDLANRRGKLGAETGDGGKGLHGRNLNNLLRRLVRGKDASDSGLYSWVLFDRTLDSEVRRLYGDLFEFFLPLSVACAEMHRRCRKGQDRSRDSGLLMPRGPSLRDVPLQQACPGHQWWIIGLYTIEGDPIHAGSSTVRPEGGWHGHGTSYPGEDYSRGN